MVNFSASRAKPCSASRHRRNALSCFWLLFFDMAHSWGSVVWVAPSARLVGRRTVTGVHGLPQSGQLVADIHAPGRRDFDVHVEEVLRKPHVTRDPMARLPTLCPQTAYRHRYGARADPAWRTPGHRRAWSWATASSACSCAPRPRMHETRIIAGAHVPRAGSPRSRRWSRRSPTAPGRRQLREYRKRSSPAGAPRSARRAAPEGGAGSALAQ